MHFFLAADAACIRALCAREFKGISLKFGVGDPESTEQGQQFVVQTYVARDAVAGGRSMFKIYYGLALLWFALGLMSKPMLVTAPFLLLLLDYWPLRRICDLRDKEGRAGGTFRIAQQLKSVVRKGAVFS